MLTLAQDIEPNNYTKLQLPVPFPNGIFKFRGQKSTSCIPHHALTGGEVSERITSWISGSTPLFLEAKQHKQVRP